MILSIISGIIAFVFLVWMVKIFGKSGHYKSSGRDDD